MKICEGNCIQCGVCLAVCPQRCITWRETPWGEKEPEIKESECIQCGICSRRCPANRTPNAMRPMEVYAAYSLSLIHIYTNLLIGVSGSKEAADCCAAAKDSGKYFSRAEGKYDRYFIRCV